MTREELLNNICSLNDAITGVIISDYVVVKSCDFTNISFASISIMSNVIFVDCKFVNASFVRNVLSFCTFIGCDLSNCTFMNCELKYSRFVKTVGKETSLCYCDLDVVKFVDVRMDDMTIRYDEHYSYDINLYILSSVMPNLSLVNIDAYASINIEYSHLYGTHIDESCLGDDVIICGTYMKNLWLSDTNIYSSIIRDSDLSNSTINSEYISPMCHNVNFSNSRIHCDDMDGARYTDCDMTNVELDRITIKNSTFDNCAMVYTNMSDCYEICNSEFKSDKLIGTNMQQITLSDCDFSGCFVTDIKLTKVNFNRIIESSPNHIYFLPEDYVTGIKWDGLDIMDVDCYNDSSTLKQSIININKRRKMTCGKS